jgi:hypothetical protein
MPTPAEVLRDPQFKALPEDERRKVLQQLDPSFRSLAMPEQNKVLGIGVGDNKPDIPTTPGMLESFGKGAVDVLQGTGASALRFATSPYELGRKATGNKLPALPEAVQKAREAPPTIGGKIGEVGADIAEFFIPAGLVNRGAKALESGSAALNIAGRAGLEAASAAGVTGMQTGFDPNSMAKAGVVAGGVTAGGKALSELTRTRHIKELGQDIPKLGMEFKVPMTRAQQTQGNFQSMWESIVRRSLLGSAVFRKFDATANQQLVKAADQIAASISGTKMTTYEAGEFVQKALVDADAAAGAAYENVVGKTVLPQAGKIPLAVTGDLRSAAQELLKEIEKPTKFAPALRNVEGLQKSIDVLRNFAEPFDVVPATTSPLVAPVGTGLGTAPITTAAQKVPRTLTFEDAKLLRTLLFKVRESGEMNIGKGSLGQLNKALDESMQTALKDAGRPDLAKAFRSASDSYREFKDLFENSVIEGLAKSDKPDTIIDVFLREGASKTATDTLGKLVKDPAKLNVIRRGVFERLFSGAQTEGILVHGKLQNVLDNLGEPAIKSLFGSDPALLSKIKRFSKLVDTVSLGTNLTRPVSSQAPSLLALGESGIVGGALGGGMVATALHSPQGLFLALGTAGSTMLGPLVLAKIMTRPAAVDMLNRALTTSATSTAGISLLNKLSAIAGVEMTKTPIDISAAAAR